jgi:hypothetical protein
MMKLIHKTKEETPKSRSLDVVNCGGCITSAFIPSSDL